MLDAFLRRPMSAAVNNQPEVCNVLGDSITLRLTKEQTDGKYSVAEFATPDGVGQPPHTHAWDGNLRTDQAEGS